MAGARYQRVNYTGVAGLFQATPDATFLTTAGSVGLSNVRGVTVSVIGPAGEAVQSGGLEAYAQVPTNVLANNAPEAATFVWVRAPKFDFAGNVGDTNFLASYDVTASGLVAFRLALLPAALQFSAGTALSLVYSVRLWGI